MDLYKNKKTGNYYVICMDDTNDLDKAIFWANKYSELNINYEILLPDYKKIDSLDVIREIRKNKLKKINNIRYGDCD